MIIWLASYPRSGNTYLRLLLYHYFEIDTFSVYAERNSPIENWSGKPLPKPLKAIAMDEDVYFIKTHELPSDDFPAIYLVRDGRDALVSYAHYILKYEQVENNIDEPASFTKTLRDLILYNASFGGWGPNVIGWLTRSAPTSFIKFEDLIALKNPKQLIKQALKNLGYISNSKSRTVRPLTFNKLHKQNSDFFRKGRTGAWKDEMPLDLQKLFLEKNTDVLALMNYETSLENSSPKKIFVLNPNQKDKVKENHINNWINNNVLTNLELIKTSYHKDKINLELSQKLIESQEEAVKKEQVISSQKDQLLEQQRLISSQKDELQMLEKTITEKEHVIQSFHHSMEYWLRYGPLRYLPFSSPFFRFLFRIKRIFTPKLGVLDQYSPREVHFDPSGKKTPNLDPETAPVISIVTPSFNQGHFIEHTIKSVLEQGYPKLQYVIQDGNSTDTTLDILKSYQGQLTHYESIEDNGQAHAVNLGFRHTTGEIMAYLNSDDMLFPGTLPYVAKYFIEHPEVDVVYGHRLIVNEDNQEIGVWVMPKHDPKVLLWADYVPQETIFWRRRIWDAIGGTMDESFHFALDWDLLLRFQQAGAKIVRLPRFLGIFRYHAAQKSTSQIETRGVKEMNRLRKTLHGRDVSLQEVVKHIKPYLRVSVIYHILYRLGILRY